VKKMHGAVSGPSESLKTVGNIFVRLVYAPVKSGAKNEISRFHVSGFTEVGL
jgi:hypothetical protein